ncbi:sulfatase-like hydrolase/transferase [Maribacter sp. 2-571]|uniref:sulfatase-like hydrolase/transferase n=1 Tax=Maribacter sp. 2-571 TaxID=3417569 RepID=UPI003D355CB2
MKILLFICPIFLFLSCKKTVDPPQPRPNIVFIFADDMTYTAIRALGNDIVHTPNLDRLVLNGSTFTNAYNMGAWNGAVCVASRAMLISGRSVWDARDMSEKWKTGKQLENTWGKLMEKAGYDTYMTGKWHVDAPADSVFQQTAHVRPGMPGDAWINSGKGGYFNWKNSDELPIGYNRPKNERDTAWSPSDPKFGGFWKGGQHWSEVLRDDAISFIQKAEKSENPFFMYLAFNAPHDPRQAPKEFLEKYDLKDIGVPKSFLPEYPFKDSIGTGSNLRDEALAPYPRTEYAVKVHLKEYYAAISHVDAQIGAIVDMLKSAGKMNNTYLIFTADHGLSVGRHGLLGKQSQYDHSIRAPFIFSGPGIPKNKKIPADIYLQDAMATSLQLAGMDAPDFLFFNSVLDLAKGIRTESAYDGIYGAYMTTQRMIRKNGFKLIAYPKLNKILLFDLKKDPEEQYNLAKDAQYSEHIKTLFRALLDKQQELNDPLDLTHLM